MIVLYTNQKVKMSSLLRSRVAPVLSRIVSTSRSASSGSDIIKSREFPEDKVTHTGQVNMLKMVLNL